MKNGSYRLIYKTLAFLLCVVTILTTLAGGAMVVALALGGSAKTEEAFLEQYLSGLLAEDARKIQYVYCQETESTLPVETLMDYWGWPAEHRVRQTENGKSDVYPGLYLGESNLRYTIQDLNGKILAGNYEGTETLAKYQGTGSGEHLQMIRGRLLDLERNYNLAGWYYIDETEPTAAETDDADAAEPTEAGAADAAEPREAGAADATEPMADEAADTTEATAAAEQEGDWNPYVQAWYWEGSDREFTVTVYLLKDLSYEDDSYAAAVPVLRTLYAHRGLAVWLLMGGLLGTVLLLVYLCAGAGRRAGTSELCLSFPDKIPLDVFMVLTLGIQAGLGYLGAKILATTEFSSLLGIDNGWVVNLGYGLAAIGVLGAVIAALGLGLVLSVVTRCKYGKGYWWRRSVLGWCLRWCLRGLRSLYGLLPVIWRWLLLGLALWILNWIAALSVYDGEGLIILGTLVFLGMTAYGAWAMGRLQKQAAKLASGDFTGETPRHMHGVFRRISRDMGAVGQGAAIAVENQMKSERLKTELITNVSHDIKTPLTSIVNYVDLLQKPHSPEQEREYLEVLDRQSKRMKKLIEDLVEMSKASTGNIPAYLTPTNLVEIANQALAEYDGKLKLAGLTPELTVLGKDGRPKAPEAAVTVMADGRLLWRVLDNLLGNAVKYALPGTRLYVDIVEYEKSVMLSVKNVSRERLNISADELMERFVRGDASRSTEGSGLGLNIAKSLMELQKGKLNLVVDGDLFKAVLLYSPMEGAAEAPAEPQEA